MVRAMVGKNLMVSKRANKGIFLPKNGTFHSSGREKPDGVLRRPTFLPVTHGERLHTTRQFLGQPKTLCGHSPPPQFTPIRSDPIPTCFLDKSGNYSTWCQIHYAWKSLMTSYNQMVEKPRRASVDTAVGLWIESECRC